MSQSCKLPHHQTLTYMTSIHMYTGRFFVAAAIMATSNNSSNGSSSSSSGNSNFGSVYGRATSKPTAAQYRAAVALCLPGDASPSSSSSSYSHHNGSDVSSGRLATTLSARALAGFDLAVRHLQVTEQKAHAHEREIEVDNQNIYHENKNRSGHICLFSYWTPLRNYASFIVFHRRRMLRQPLRTKLRNPQPPPWPLACPPLGRGTRTPMRRCSARPQPPLPRAPWLHGKPLCRRLWAIVRAPW